jgi:hypothetical protein
VDEFEREVINEVLNADTGRLVKRCVNGGRWVCKQDICYQSASCYGMKGEIAKLEAAPAVRDRALENRLDGHQPDTK